MPKMNTLDKLITTGVLEAEAFPKRMNIMNNGHLTLITPFERYPCGN